MNELDAAYEQLPEGARAEPEVSAWARLSADGVPAFMHIIPIICDMMVHL